MRTTTRVALTALILMMTLMTATTRATAETKREAAKHFASAVELVDKGRIQAALAEFLQAYDLSPTYAVLYNIGLAYADLGKPTQAEDALRRYLHDGGESVPKIRKDDVERRLADLERRIGLVDIELDVPDAIILVDGVEVGRSPLGAPIRVDAGTHEVSSARTGYRSVTRSVSVLGEHKSMVTLALERNPEPGTHAPLPQASSAATDPTSRPAEPRPTDSPRIQREAAAPRDPGRRPSHTGNAQRVVGIAAGVIGLVGLGVGTYFALQSLSKGEESNRLCGIGGISNACTDRGLELNREAIQASTAAIVCFAVGGAMAAGGLTLILTAPTGASPSAGAGRPLRTSTFWPHGIAIAGTW